MLSRVQGSVTNNNGFWIGFIDALYSQLVLTSNTGLSLIYTVYSSPLLLSRHYNHTLVTELKQSLCD
jgi:hypothetical protein